VFIVRFAHRSAESLQQPRSNGTTGDVIIRQIYTLGSNWCHTTGGTENAGLENAGLELNVPRSTRTTK